MNIANSKKEPGQVLVLIAIAFVALLGFTALAIDGGMVYSDRRQAQNAADAAALAGSLQKAQGQTDAAAVSKAEEVLTTNDFNPSQAVIVVSQGSDAYGSFDQVQVELSSTTKMFFAQLFGFNEVQNQVRAVAKSRSGSGGPGDGAIIAMGDCTAGDPTLLNTSGGGNSGGILAYGGDIFLNSPDPNSGNCSIDSPNSAKNWGIRALDGHEIYSIGEYNYSGEPKIEPLPIQTGYNGGTRFGDPLWYVEEPICTQNGGQVSPGVYKPGAYNGNFPESGKIMLKPGIYCISGDVKMSGPDELKGDGVLLYLINGSFESSGKAALNLTAPTDMNCLGSDGDRTASCNYKGLVFFMARGQHNEIIAKGNGGVKITGTVYALDGDVQMNGGGQDPQDWTVMGQVIARSLDGRGNGSFVVNYNSDVVYHGKPSISLIK